ncbi:MAG: Crp/Fnr family transcriptional regulator [Pseudomonadota bacterium]
MRRSPANGVYTPQMGEQQQTNLHTGVLTVLQNSPIFSALPDSLLREIAALSTTRTYQQGELVFQRHDPGDYLYGVISGSLRISVSSPDGRELALSTTGPGEIGGEISVLDGGTRTTSGRALETTLVFTVPRQPFAGLMLRQPSIALHMIQLLCARVRQTSQQVEDAAFLSLPQRLAGQLHNLVQALEQPLPCTVKISQSELASFLNVSRQVVNGCLQEWQRLGFIQLGRGHVKVSDLNGLLVHVQSDRTAQL